MPEGLQYASWCRLAVSLIQVFWDVLVKGTGLLCPKRCTAFLDVSSRIETMSLLHDTAHRQRKAILLSTHDIDNALIYSDRLLLLSSGGAGAQESGACTGAGLPDAADVSSDVPEPSPIISGSPEDLVLDGSLSRFFSRRGMDFDIRSGRLSTGVAGPEVGVDGDSLTVRWMANALARNGFTPVLPADGIPCVRCVSPTCLEVSHPGSATSVTVSCISQVIQYLMNLS